MNCPEYLNLDLQQRIILIGSVCHLLQNNSEAFMAISSLVRSAAQKGEFDGVEILPERHKDNL